MRASYLAGILLAASALQCVAQNESRVGSDFRREGDSLKACVKFSFGSLTDCGQTLVTGQPMHIAVGSLSPQNGFGAGIAFVEHTDQKSEWRDNWDVDALATDNGSWRAGGYLKAYRLGGGLPKLTYPSSSAAAAKKKGPFFTVSPLFYLYSQSISLNRVDYFGLGPNTVPIAHTTYGFSENITGLNAALPIGGRMGWAKASILAELNGRFPSVRAGTDFSLPSIGTFFSEATAPGLTHQPAYLEPSEGLRLYPALFKDHIRLDYLLQFQQFVAPGSGYTFRRSNGDFSHEIPLYALLPKSASKLYLPNRGEEYSNNGPDDCTGVNSNISPQRAATIKKDPARPCPAITTTAKLEGSITLRAFLSESFADKGNVVPFYFSPTIGGSDINGTTMLASYPDYRFRGPDLLLFRGAVEHSLGKIPIGAVFSVDEGKIGLQRDDVSLDHLRHTFTVGMTVRAGGLPVVYLLFAWGGHEGTHTTAQVSPFLLGGSARPSLF
jgi:hypothetical protein